MKSENQLFSLSREHYALIRYSVEAQMEIWGRTAKYWKDGEVDGEIEESNSLYEAEEMVTLYRNLLEDVDRAYSC